MYGFWPKWSVERKPCYKLNRNDAPYYSCSRTQRNEERLSAMLLRKVRRGDVTDLIGHPPLSPARVLSFLETLDEIGDCTVKQMPLQRMALPGSYYEGANNDSGSRHMCSRRTILSL